MSHVTEPQKQIPIASEVDVVVAGGSVAGVFAAIAAGREGVRTALVERFGSVGGNIGPGMIVGGHMISGRAHEKVWNECTIYPRLYGIAKELLDRSTDSKTIVMTPSAKGTQFIEKVSPFFDKVVNLVPEKKNN